jgi:tetratricopeptide (TPR) repeat protein
MKLIGACAAAWCLIVAATAWGQGAGGPAGRPTTRPAAAPTSQQAQTAEEKFEQGRKKFFQGLYKDAIPPLEEASRTNPAKTSYRLLLAKAYRYAGRDKDAAGILEAILKENPEHVEAGVELSEMLSPAKEPDRVIGILAPLLKFKHDYPLYHMLAEAYYQKEQWEQACENYQEAVKLNPQSPQDWYQLGNIYLAQKHFARSAEAYETAGRLGIDSAVYHFKLASVYFNLRNYLGAVTTAVVLGGQAGQIKNDLLLLDAAPGRKDAFYAAPPKSAIFRIAKARQLGIDTPQIRFLEANIWLSARRFAKADAIYKAMQAEGKLDKADLGLFWFYWSQTALGLDDFDNFLGRLTKAIEAEPDVYKSTQADAYVTVARRYQAKGDHNRYVEYLKQAVATNPMAASLHLMLGDACWQAGLRNQAVEQYKLVLELEPDHADRVKLLNRIREPIPATTQPAAPTPPGASGKAGSGKAG